MWAAINMIKIIIVIYKKIIVSGIMNEVTYFTSDFKLLS